jgi:N-acetylglucosaminyl-diphospho-decaprenol L-rhamnosyltransferase
VSDPAAAVTVVVVTWDSVNLLPSCLASLRGQEWHGRRPHLVVVDNASTDGTGDWLADHAIDVEVMTAPRNLGFAGGANLGIGASSTPYVAVLNDDATVDSGWLAALADDLDAKENARVAAVTPRVLLAGRELVNSTGNEMTRSGRGRDRDWRTPATKVRPAGEVFGFCGNGALLRRAALDEVGMFDAALFLYYEDTDLSWRMRAAGWTVRHQPEAVVEHRHATSSGEGSPRFTRWNERNSLVVVTRHAPAGVVLAAHLRRMGGLLVHTARDPRSAVTRARWRALAEHIRWLPRTLRDRRRIWMAAAVPRREVAALLVQPVRSQDPSDSLR